MKIDRFQKNLPSNFSSKELNQFFQGVDVDKWLEEREKELWILTGCKPTKVETQVEMLNERVERACVNWACISAKTQREQNFKGENGVSFTLKIYDRLTTVTPQYERIGGMKPPDRTDNPIYKFSEKSRTRLMNKARRLDKSELPLPFFVTLTYRDNYQDPKGAKDHLNTFFQRWRRKDRRFAYFWKMEPQKRGAVHFHLALFIPYSTQKKILQEKQDQLRELDWEASRINALRLKIQRDWAEVTKDVSGIRIPYTSETFVDPVHEWAGTNVRKVDNWKMFLGYCYKYCGKEVDNPFGENVETGRFWGFSYNLDFSAKKVSKVDFKDIEELNQFCNTLNTLAFWTLVEHLKNNAQRKKKELADKPKKLRENLAHLRAVYEKQKRRFMINREKIKEGRSLQFEIKSKLSLDCERLVKSENVETFFGIE